MLGKKLNNLEPGYVFAPYIIQQQSTGIISDGGFYSKNDNRKNKINNIFDLGLKCSKFGPKKSLKSRYSKKTISSKYYNEITIKKPN